MRCLARAIAFSIFVATICGSIAAQNPQKLSLEEAEKIAIQNHPQIQAAANLPPLRTRKSLKRDLPIFRRHTEASPPWTPRTTAASRPED